MSAGGRRGTRVAAAATVLLLACAWSAGVAGADTVTPIARTVAATSVYANPTATPTLSTSQRQRLIAEIARRDRGRLFVAVATAQEAAAAGGVSGLANALDRRIGRPGTTLVVAGSQLWVVTSYANTTAAENAVRDAFAGDRPLAPALQRSVAGIARVDPDRAGGGLSRTGSATRSATTALPTRPQTSAGGAAPVAHGNTPSSGLPTWLVLALAFAGAVVPLTIVRMRRDPAIGADGRHGAISRSPGAMRSLRGAPLGRPRPARWYARASFWTGPFSMALGGGLAILLGLSWIQFGGLPRAYARYGRVPVPGRQVLQLPAGRVMIDFENGLFGAGTDQASLLGPPDGMRVRITRASGDGAPLQLTSVPSWLFESDGQNNGHRPYARIDVPQAGRYLLEAGDAGHPLPASPDRSGSAGLAGVGGPVIAAGEKPWTPLGSPLIGGILVAVLVFAVFCIPYAFTRLRR